MEHNPQGQFDLLAIFQDADTHQKVEDFVQLLSEGTLSYVPNVTTKVYQTVNFVSQVVSSSSLLVPKLASDAIKINYFAEFGAILTDKTATAMLHHFCKQINVDSETIIGINFAGVFDTEYCLRMLVFLVISAEMDHKVCSFLLSNVRGLMIPLANNAALILDSTIGKHSRRRMQKAVMKVENQRVRTPVYHMNADVEICIRGYKTLESMFDALAYDNDCRATYRRLSALISTDPLTKALFKDISGYTDEFLNKLGNEAIDMRLARPLEPIPPNVAPIKRNTFLFLKMCQNQTAYDFYKKALKQNSLHEENRHQLIEKMRELERFNDPRLSMFSMFSAIRPSVREFQHQWCLNNLNLYPNYRPENYDLPHHFDPHNPPNNRGFGPGRGGRGGRGGGFGGGNQRPDDDDDDNDDNGFGHNQGNRNANNQNFQQQNDDRRMQEEDRRQYVARGQEFNFPQRGFNNIPFREQPRRGSPPNSTSRDQSRQRDAFYSWPQRFPRTHNSAPRRHSFPNHTQNTNEMFDQPIRPGREPFGFGGPTYEHHGPTQNMNNEFDLGTRYTRPTTNANNESIYFSKQPKQFQSQQQNRAGNNADNSEQINGNSFNSYNRGSVLREVFDGVRNVVAEDPVGELNDDNGEFDIAETKDTPYMVPVNNDGSLPAQDNAEENLNQLPMESPVGSEGKFFLDNNAHVDLPLAQNAADKEDQENQPNTPEIEDALPNHSPNSETALIA